MKTIQVKYKGPRDAKDFTYNQIYQAQELSPSYLLVLNDAAILVEMPSVDFDFSIAGYSRNWLAYCKHHELDPEHKPGSMANFISWINARSFEYRKIHQLTQEQPIGHLESWVSFLEKGNYANQIN